ncbi:integrase arm-type DNA-binding domain-containing protein [uncultured Pseudacidovorax sp.]|uniref:tyrosine-type recombinase/integrase n=1 Tax=uncultured Pseudacidovorax sp. TaxID=679313 RepID=UPI0025D85838|nr:integrase arm-type DNA-binding domain-containing protein [uncultured Pseudacidovorax sp.]
MKLADTKLRKLTTPGKHADGGGLYLEVTAAGGRYWRMKYRFGGKEKRLAFGVYPTVGLKEARELREAAKQALARGEDPGALKKAARASVETAAANTVQAVGLDWLAIQKDGWSDTHYVREERNLRKDVFPYLGKRPIQDIEPPELLKVIRKVEERGALDVAHRVLLTARGVWQHAVANGHAQRDITQDIKKALKPHLKRNLPAVTEPAKLGALLRASEAYQGGPVVRAALAIAPILFQRPGNLRVMRWADLDLEAGLWSIPSMDMKRTKVQKINGQPHIVPLPRQVVATLRELQPLTGHREFVFPGFRDPSKPMSEAGVNAALHALGYKDVHTWHGYRATGRTILRQVLKFPVDIIEGQLAHKGQITHGGAYDRAQHVEERADMLQVWADYLDQLRCAATVLPLSPRPT